MEVFVNFLKANKKKIIVAYLILLAILFILPFCLTKRVSVGKEYTDKYEVALYLVTYRELPKNYVTKSADNYLKSKNKSDEGLIIGGDDFFDLEKLNDFNIGANAGLRECDIWYVDYSLQLNENEKQPYRGQERLLYTTNADSVRVFYTANHYDTFVELTDFGLQFGRNVAWIVFAVYAALGAVAFVIYTKSNHRLTPPMPEKNA